MSKAEIYEKINIVFRDIFDDENITVDETTVANDIEEWDSLQHISLIAAIEEEFEVKFSMDEMLEMHSVADMVRFIEIKK